MQRPGQALGDVKGDVVPSLLHLVHYQLLSLVDVQKEVVVLTPAGP